MPTAWRIDLNCDLGEGGSNDADLMRCISSANIACGVHAGSAALMRETVRLALKHGVGIGAHPGLADTANMGRQAVQVTPQEAFDLVATQVRALAAIATELGAKLQHVKPHGALYNMSAKNMALAVAIARAVYSIDQRLVLFGLAGSESITAARQVGLAPVEEAFADRGYEPDGSLTPRDKPGALIDDPDAAARRAVRLVKQHKISATNDVDLTLHAQTLCVHGDTPSAPQILRRIREVFQAEHIEVRRVGQL